MTTLKSHISVPENVLFREVGGEAVILNVYSGKYFGLDEIGTRMWILLAQHRRLEPAYQVLLAEYDVTEDQLYADLIKLVDDLALHGLVTIGDETPLA